jgi:ribosomal peptide maturation radical SAM protein 1
MHQESKVLFVTMPWLTPVHPSLAMGLLSAILNRAGIPADCLYGNLCLPRPSQEGVFALPDPGQYEDRCAGLSFVPHLYTQIDAGMIAKTVAERFLRIVSREGQIDIGAYWSGSSEDEIYNTLVEQTTSDIQGAETCLARCLDTISQSNYDIIGFSLTFETQLIASVALASRIKKRWPHVRIVFGGAACTAGQGVALLKSYDFIDVVCLGEADELIVPLVRALRGDGKLDDLGGIAFRSGQRVQVNQTAEPIRNLDRIPIPEYASFFEQKKKSEWSDAITVLLFETSRGCWWGEKHLCTFCGLNAESLTFRSKSAAKVMEEITALAESWDVVYGLQAVDNILDMKYFKDLVPMMGEFQSKREKPLGIFFEIKSNLKLTHFFQLAAAGVMTLQPGIESFSDHILKLMDKGANALQQVNFIKWANQIGIRVTYNILMRNPGETAEDYRLMTRLVPYIMHLQPPHGIANMQLERYSPYFLRPETFGMRNVRPQPHYNEMFPDPNVNISDLVYQFDFDHDDLDAPELVEARREFTFALLDWKGKFKPRSLKYSLKGESVVITDERGDEHQTYQLDGWQREIFTFIDQPQSFSSIARNFPEIAAGAIRAFLERLKSRSLVYHHINDHYVALPIRAYMKNEFYAEMNRQLESAKASAVNARKSRELFVLPGMPGNEPLAQLTGISDRRASTVAGNK